MNKLYEKIRGRVFERVDEQTGEKLLDSKGNVKLGFYIPKKADFENTAYYTAYSGEIDLAFLALDNETPDVIDVVTHMNNAVYWICKESGVDPFKWDVFDFEHNFGGAIRTHKRVRETRDYGNAWSGMVERGRVEKVTISKSKLVDVIMDDCYHVFNRCARPSRTLAKNAKERERRERRELAKLKKAEKAAKEDKARAEAIAENKLDPMQTPAPSERPAA